MVRWNVFIVSIVKVFVEKKLSSLESLEKKCLCPHLCRQDLIQLSQMPEIHFPCMLSLNMESGFSQKVPLKVWTYAHNYYSILIIFMYDLGLFYFSKPLFNTIDSEETKKLIQSLLLCTACLSGWKCKNVRMHEVYQKRHWAFLVCKNTLKKFLF